MPRSFTHLNAIRLERQLAAVDAQGRGSRDSHAQHGFDPSQPRLPAGQPDGGQWTSGGGSTLNDERVISDSTLDNDWNPGSQYANAGRRGPVPVRILGRLVEVEPAQAARLEIAQASAHGA